MDDSPADMHPKTLLSIDVVRILVLLGPWITIQLLCNQNVDINGCNLNFDFACMDSSPTDVLIHMLIPFTLSCPIGARAWAFFSNAPLIDRA